jgi:hypothetical protein
MVSWLLDNGNLTRFVEGAQEKSVSDARKIKSLVLITVLYG